MTHPGKFKIRPAPISANDRRAVRVPVRGRARLREVGYNPFDVELFDLSETGFRMATFGRPRIGARVWINLPGLQALEAVVRRAAGNDVGCEFVQPLHPSVAQHLQIALR